MPHLKSLDYAFLQVVEEFMIIMSLSEKRKQWIIDFNANRLLVRFAFVLYVLVFTMPNAYSTEPDTETGSFVIQLKLDFGSADALKIVQKHLTHFSFKGFPTPESEARLNAWLCKPREWSDITFEQVCPNAFGDSTQTKGLISVKALECINLFLSQNYLENVEHQCVRWVYEMMKIIQSSALSYKQFSEHLEESNKDQLIRELETQAKKSAHLMEQYLTEEASNSFKRNYSRAFHSILGHIQCHTYQFQCATVWATYLSKQPIDPQRVSLDEPVAPQKECLGVLAGWISDKIVNLDEMCHPILTDQGRDNVRARLYRKLINEGDTRFFPALALLFDERKVSVGYSGSPIDSSNPYAHDEEAARVYRLMLRYKEWTGMGTLNLAILIEHQRIQTNREGHRIDRLRDQQAHYKIAGRLYQECYEKTKDINALMNLARLIKRELFDEDEKGNRIPEGQRHEVDARMIREGIRQNVPMAYHNLGVLIENGYTDKDASGLYIPLEKRAEMVAICYGKAIEAGCYTAYCSLAGMIDGGKAFLDEKGKVIQPENRMKVAADYYKKSRTEIGDLNLARLLVRHPYLLNQFWDGSQKLEHIKQLVESTDKKSAEMDLAMGYVNKEGIVVGLDYRSQKELILGLAYLNFMGDKERAIALFKESALKGNSVAYWNYVKHAGKTLEILESEEVDSDEESLDEQILPQQLSSPILVLTQESVIQEKQRQFILVQEEECQRRLAFEGLRENALRVIARKYEREHCVQERLQAVQHNQIPPITNQKEKQFTREAKAEEDYVSLDSSGQFRYMTLIQAIKNGERTGHPKTLSYRLKDGTPLCTRRMSDEHRLVYTMDSKGDVTIWGILGHDDTIDKMNRQRLLSN